MGNIGRFGKLKIIGLDQGFLKLTSNPEICKKGGGWVCMESNHDDSELIYINPESFDYRYYYCQE